MSPAPVPAEMQSGPKDIEEVLRVLRVGSEQISLALRESQPSVDALGAALERVAGLLASSTPPVSSGEDVAAIIRAEMTRAIVGLQYHDRMNQHLTHIRDYLAGSASQLQGSDAQPGSPWTSLHSQLAARLLSDTQRMFLGEHFQDGEGPGRQRRSDRSPPGDVDLF